MEKMQTGMSVDEIIIGLRDIYADLPDNDESGTGVEEATSFLVSKKDKLHELSEAAKQTLLFKGGIDLFNEVINRLDNADMDRDCKLSNAWNNLNNKLAGAPTTLHFKGAAMLLIPVVDHVLQKYC